MAMSKSENKARRLTTQRLYSAASAAHRTAPLDDEMLGRVRRVLKALKRRRLHIEPVLREASDLTALLLRIAPSHAGPEVAAPVEDSAVERQQEVADWLHSAPVTESATADHRPAGSSRSHRRSLKLAPSIPAPQSPNRFRSPSELTADQLAAFADRQRLVALILRDRRTYQQARDETGLTGLSLSHIGRLVARYQAHGDVGLQDWRWSRVTKKRIPAEVRAQLRHLMYKHRGATLSSLTHELRDFCIQNGLEMPSYQWMTKYVRRIPRDEREARQLKLSEWSSRSAPTAKINRAEYGNQRWVADHTDADVWVRFQLADGSWDIGIPYITAIIDEYSRAVMGLTVSLRHPDAWTALLTMRHALIGEHPSGFPDRQKPEAFFVDREKNLISPTVTTPIRALGISFELSLPHYPNCKGSIERFFRTLKENRLASVPGYKYDHQISREAALKRIDEMLTLPQLRDLINQWIRDHYHVTPHGGLSADGIEWTPEEAWAATARGASYDPEELEILLLKQDDVRTIRNTGIRITVEGRRRDLWAPWVAENYGRRIRLAMNPEESHWAVVFDETGRTRLGEVYDLRSEDSPWTLQDVHAARRTRRAVIARLQHYHRETQRTDRQSPTAYRKAKRAAAAAAKAVRPQASAPVDSNLVAKIRQLRSAAPRKAADSTESLHPGARQLHQPNARSDIASKVRKLRRLA